MTQDAPTAVGPLLAHLCDDAAIFPPGLKPLEQAVPDHLGHGRSGHAGYVGPFLLSAAALQEAGPVVAGLAAGAIDLALTVPDETALPDALARVDELPAFRLVAVEVPLSTGIDPAVGIAAIQAAVAGRDIEVFVEIPRDDRRPDAIAAVQAAGYQAKFRTGGIRAELYPDEAELADGIIAVVSRGLPFKATAGLHHAVRNTDPDRGFEQHGFLNILQAVSVVLDGGDREAVIDALAERDGAALAGRLAELDDDQARAVRRSFRSFGTCSISEPIDELTELGLVDGTPTSHQGAHRS